MNNKAILLDLPIPISTARLLIRPPGAGDGKACNEAIIESFSELNTWMPWAREQPTIDESEAFARQASADWITRKELLLWIYDKDSGEFIGASGFRNIDWTVPCFEIGYWLRNNKTGQGLMTEAVSALTTYAFEILKAVRIEIRCDEGNLKSQRVAERTGFKLEATLKRNTTNSLGVPVNTVVYSQLAALTSSKPRQSEPELS